MWERIPVDRPGNESRVRLGKYRWISLDIRLSDVDGEGRHFKQKKFIMFKHSVFCSSAMY